MPGQNLGQRRVINPILSNVVRGYRNAAYIGYTLFPPVPVKTMGGQIITFGKEAMKLYNTLRAPGAATARIDFGYKGEDFVLQGHALEAKVPDEDANEAKEAPGRNLAGEAVSVAQDALLLGLEYDQAKIATDAAKYGANNKLTLAGTDKWSDYANSDPGKDVIDAKAAVRATSGMEPNVLAMGPQVYDVLIQHPKITERFKYVQAGILNETHLAQYFGVEKVVVGKAVYNPNNSDLFVNIWGNVAVLAYVPASSSDRRVPSYGYTYIMEGHPFVKSPYYEDNCESWIYGGKFDRAPVIAGPGSAFLFATPV